MLPTVKWIWLTLLVATLQSAVARAEFDPIRDTFAFGNETLWAYGNQQRDPTSAPQNPERRYSRHCFVMVRAVLQFHQFAVFEPQKPRLSEKDTIALIRRISRIPVSQKASEPKIPVPGFSDLRSFSKAYPGLLQDHLGKWWPTYLRPGNWRMGMAFPRSGQAELAKKLVETLDSGRLAAVYITRFKPLNHCLAVHSYRRTKTGIEFAVYDPNLPGKIAYLSFDNAKRSFFYQKTWYYRGGLVNVIRVYHNRFL